jgi:predicted DNA-binding antitoxin AbrB/MazE fold protein
MVQHVNAIYDHGVLRPLTPLNLKDNEQVQLIVESSGSAGEKSVDSAKTLFDVLDEVGLIGCISDTPPDLSSNPKYMEGFGTSGK